MDQLQEATIKQIEKYSQNNLKIFKVQYKLYKQEIWSYILFSRT